MLRIKRESLEEIQKSRIKQDYLKTQMTPGKELTNDN